MAGEAGQREVDPPIGVPLIGVLALQGGVAEHVRSLHAAGARTVLIRRPDQLEALDGIVLPGGESSTIDRLLRLFGIAEPLRDRIIGGLPTLATCAGMVALAERIEDPAPGQQTLRVLPISVRRNAFGRQVVSEEAVVQTVDGPVRAAFIRAPIVTGILDGTAVLDRRDGSAVLDRTDGTEVIARHRGEIVGVRQRNVTAVAFHPELTGDLTLHAALVRAAVGMAVH